MNINPLEATEWFASFNEAAGKLSGRLIKRPKAILVLHAMAWHLPRARCGHGRLATLTGIKRRAIPWWIKYLQAIGFFTVKGGRGQTPEYVFTPLDHARLDALIARWDRVEAALHARKTHPSLAPGYRIIVDFIAANPLEPGLAAAQTKYVEVEAREGSPNSGGNFLLWEL